MRTAPPRSRQETCVNVERELGTYCGFIFELYTRPALFVIMQTLTFSYSYVVVSVVTRTYELFEAF